MLGYQRTREQPLKRRDDDVIRTVKENAKTLKFDTAEFEDE